MRLPAAAHDLDGLDGAVVERCLSGPWASRRERHGDELPPGIR
jgi:hypothetical protein